MESQIHELLHSLSITRNYIGYEYIITACKLILMNESLLHSVMKSVYPPVAEAFGCNTHNIERNIRTVIFHAWKYRRERFSEIAGYPLSAPPTVSEFLAILCNCVKKHQTVCL